MAFDKSALKQKRLNERDVEIPGLGKMRVRGLTRSEALDMGVGTGQAVDLALVERKVLAKTLVDPVLTEDEVGEWQANSPANEINVVFEAVLEMSGLKPELEVAKETMHRFPS